MCRGQDDVSCDEQSAAAVPGRYVLQRDHVGVGTLDRIHPANDVMCRRRCRPGMRRHRSLLVIRTTAGDDRRAASRRKEVFLRRSVASGMMTEVAKHSSLVEDRRDGESPLLPTVEWIGHTPKKLNFN